MSVCQFSCQSASHSLSLDTLQAGTRTHKDPHIASGTRLGPFHSTLHILRLLDHIAFIHFPDRRVLPQSYLTLLRSQLACACAHAGARNLTPTPIHLYPAEFGSTGILGFAKREGVTCILRTRLVLVDRHFLPTPTPNYCLPRYSVPPYYPISSRQHIFHPSSDWAKGIGIQEKKQIPSCESIGLPRSSPRSHASDCSASCEAPACIGLVWGRTWGPCRHANLHLFQCRV